MALLLPNNPETDIAALTALKTIIVPNTQLALGSSDGTGLSQVYINNLFALSQGSFPAVHLSSNKQPYTPRSRATYTGSVDLVVRYYDRWDSRNSTFDALYAKLSLDLERMKANIENNDTFTSNQRPVIPYDIRAFGCTLINRVPRRVGTGVSALETIVRLAISPYSPEVERSFPGLSLLFRTLTISCRLPEYDA